MLLANATDIQSVLLVKLSIPYYVQNPGDTPTNAVLTFCDGGLRTYTYDGENYIGLGHLMGVSQSTSELKSTSGEITITLSGIPNTSLYEILNSRFKGSSVQVFRAYYDPNTGEEITVGTGNVSTRFKGFINNYSLQEDYDPVAKTASSTIVFTCSSAIAMLQQRKSGRKTNQASQQKYFPNDVSMNRVSTLQNAYFDFGKKKA